MAAWCSAFSIEQAFSVINDSALTVGADADITYLVAVLNKPTVEIYCDSPQWKTEGYWSEKIYNTGNRQYPPGAKEVLDSSLNLLMHKALIVLNTRLLTLLRLLLS